MNDQTPKPVIRSTSGQSRSTGGLADRAKFEKWYQENMDNHASFILYFDTPYYDDNDVQTAWRGYQAGIEAANMN